MKRNHWAVLTALLAFKIRGVAASRHWRPIVDVSPTTAFGSHGEALPLNLSRWLPPEVTGGPGGSPGGDARLVAADPCRLGTTWIVKPMHLDSHLEGLSFDGQWREMRRLARRRGGEGVEDVYLSFYLAMARRLSTGRVLRICRALPTRRARDAMLIHYVRLQAGGLTVDDAVTLMAHTTARATLHDVLFTFAWAHRKTLLDDEKACRRLNKKLLPATRRAFFAILHQG